MALVTNIGDTASVFDILGLTHKTITSTVQLSIARTVLFQATWKKAEEKARMINLNISSLMDLVQVLQLDAELFLQAWSEVKEMERELVAVHDDFNRIPIHHNS